MQRKTKQMQRLGLGFAAVVVDQKTNGDDNTDEANDRPLGRIAHNAALNDTDALKEPDSTHERDQYSNNVDSEFHYETSLIYSSLTINRVQPGHHKARNNYTESSSRLSPVAILANASREKGSLCPSTYRSISSRMSERIRAKSKVSPGLRRWSGGG